MNMGIRVVVHFKTDSLLTDTFLNLQFASSYSLNLSWTVKRNYSTLKETSLISLMHQNKIQTAAGKKINRITVFYFTQLQTQL